MRRHARAARAAAPARGQFDSHSRLGEIQSVSDIGDVQNVRDEIYERNNNK